MQIQKQRGWKQREGENMPSKYYQKKSYSTYVISKQSRC
jgi:hypothetical protein